jgi:hypothetical protein
MERLLTKYGRWRVETELVMEREARKNGMRTWQADQLAWACALPLESGQAPALQCPINGWSQLMTHLPIG